jgi:hypothetical protein
MADNTTIDAGSGGDVIATDDIGGVKYQRVKISQGADGSATDVGIGGGTEATALRVTIASDSTGVLSIDDNGAAITVDGTVTANLGATDTAALAAIETAVEILDNAISGNEMQVDIVSAPTVTVDNAGTFAVQADTELTTGDLDTGAGTDTRAVVGLAGTASGGAQLIPGSSTDGLLVNLGSNNDVTVSGVATAANQTTVIGHLDGVEGLLTTIDGDTGTVAGAVSGTEMQVDVVAALPAGTNNIGDVDVLSVVPGTGATNLGKAEDGAHTSGDVGVMSLAVRLDSAASFADTDGDYAPLQLDSAGALRVTGGGGGTEYVVDAAAPAAPTGSAGLMERDDALSALTEVEGDWTNMRANANGALWVKPDGDVTIADGGNTITVDGTVAVTGVSTAANQTTIIGHVDGIEALLGTIDADTSNLSVVGGGTEAAAIRVTLASDSTGVLSVDDNGSTISVDDGGGVLTVDGTVAVTGVATAANQTTVIGHLDGVEGLLTTIDADTGGILTSVQTLDNAISGNEMQVDVVGALPAGTATIGAVNVKPATSGGLTIFRSIDLDETEEEVKATAGQVFGWYIFNAAATTHYVKFYNATTANVTVGTTTPVLTIPVPAGSAANVFTDTGIAFGTAITAAATTGVADNDTGAPAANAVVINVFYS